MTIQDDGSQRLRAVANRLMLEPVPMLAKSAGVRDVLRITAYYPKGDAHHSVATLCIYPHMSMQTLSMVYEDLFQNKHFKHSIATSIGHTVISKLRQLGFIRLSDSEYWQTAACVWYVEYASGAFYTDGILTPDQITMPHNAISNAIDDYLPQATKRIKRDAPTEG